MQTSHNLKIRKCKFGFAKSILSDINPVGPRWVQVSAEFSIKNHQTRINLYSIYAIFYYTQEYSINRTRLAASRPARLVTRAFGARLVTRAFGARARCSPRYHAANQGGKTDGNLLGRSAWASDPPKLRLGPCPPLPGRMLRIHSPPSRNNTYTRINFARIMRARV